MEILIVWFIFCIIVGAIASNRGRSGIGWFFLAFLISPIISLILVLILSPLKSVQGQIKEPSDIAEEISKLHDLKTKGILTEEEFNNQKSKLLNFTSNINIPKAPTQEEIESMKRTKENVRESKKAVFLALGILVFIFILASIIL